MQSCKLIFFLAKAGLASYCGWIFIVPRFILHPLQFSDHIPLQYLFILTFCLSFSFFQLQVLRLYCIPYIPAIVLSVLSRTIPSSPSPSFHNSSRCIFIFLGYFCFVFRSYFISQHWAPKLIAFLTGSVLHKFSLNLSVWIQTPWKFISPHIPTQANSLNLL